MHDPSLLIIDFEATCDDQGRLPAEAMEIIEIGAVLLDGQFQRVGYFQRFVRPVKNPVLTPFCTTLTGITQRDVDGAEAFPAVARAFSHWLDAEVTVSPGRWASWGDYDRRQLARDCERHQVPAPLTLPHVNIKAAFGRVNGGRDWGISDALTHCGMRFEGDAHRGLDDALNIARLIQSDPTIAQS